jgi:hypothetical protein
MLKKDELFHPRSCLNKAAPDEPVFVLRARDPLAAATVRLWAAMATGRHEDEKVHTALESADEMEAWHNRQPKAEAVTQDGALRGGSLRDNVLRSR